MPASKHDSYPVHDFANSEEFEKWLEKHHAATDGMWLKFAKAKSGIASVTYPEAVEVALCYGWIDGLARSLDDKYYLQKFTPRRPNSIWSVINKEKVAALIKSKRMQPAGLAAVDQAKKNGRWDNAYESPKKIAVPAEFQKALNANSKAKAFFKKLSATNRFAILFRLQQLKKEETKKKRIAEYIAMLENHRTIYPQ